MNFDKLTYAGNSSNLVSIENESSYTFVNGDICDLKSVEKVFSDFLPDALVHFAAESHVDRSIENPLEFINTNVLGTAVLLENAVKYTENFSKFKFLHVSTDEVFGSLNKTGYFVESSSYDPSSPYSASKASSDHLVRAWHKTFSLRTLITNCSNNYGPYQFPEKLIPLMIANCIDEKPLPIYGQGDNIRDWLYVTDHCEAIYKVLTSGNIGETYNIGGNNEISNLEIVETICKELDKVLPCKNNKFYNELINFVEDRPGHDFRYAIDASKIKNDLGWAPKRLSSLVLKKLLAGI